MKSCGAGSESAAVLKELGKLEEGSASAQPETCGTVEMMENPRGGSGLPHHHSTTATVSYDGDREKVGAVRD